MSRLVGGWVSHMLHQYFEVSFEAVRWSVTLPPPPLPPTFCCVKPKIYSFIAKKKDLISASVSLAAHGFFAGWYRLLEVED